MGHLEDRCDTILERERGIRQEDAPAGTVAAMGVRQALGRYLKQIHSPFLIAALDFPVPTAELAFRSAEARHFFGRGEILLNVNPYVLGKDAQELYLNRAFVSRRGNLVRLRVACYLPEAVSAEITYSANDGGWHLNSRRETAAGQGCFFSTRSGRTDKARRRSGCAATTPPGTSSMRPPPPPSGSGNTASPNSPTRGGAPWALTPYPPTATRCAP